ncbi:hypothetical protein D8674_029459 [Pyrus ussuriensis x Pyrus communis]|uniref:Uncharacterized protein n=1 Tax=Pyrus ussuriensis x Pyrus communis TaxID=2448454 RepID=A0A5N5I465_9ROSA|nr:hypothetical protein D8674_029459 [Pyrus ussuriensis x Pyrus communis]
MGNNVSSGEMEVVEPPKALYRKQSHTGCGVGDDKAGKDVVDGLVRDEHADVDGLESRRRQRRKKLPKPRIKFLVADKHRGNGIESGKRWGYWGKLCSDPLFNFFKFLIKT